MDLKHRNRHVEEGQEEMMASFSGKVAIVTGSSSGIGQAIAERLAEDGAIVVVNFGTNAEKARQVVTGIQAKGGKAVAVQSDMSQVAEARRLVIETVKQFGRLDILINNAGRFMPKPLLDTTEADFDQLIALNAKGPYFAMQEAVKILKEGGRIVNISTEGTHLSFPGATAYLGSKAALEQYTKGLAQELAPRGITVNTVSPGFTETGMMTDQLRQIGIQMSPLKRLGLPNDIADVVAFIVSEEARWLTGQNIHAGGGIVM
jgi:3-oxoacyl-[acyl-carrier protein] reductase